MDQTSTSAQPTRIDIQFPKSVTSKDEDPKSDGVGVFEDSVHLNSAKLSINGGAAVQYHCPDKPPLDPDGTHFCRMVIHYCEGACTH
jgi:hypothetical protein